MDKLEPSKIYHFQKKIFKDLPIPKKILRKLRSLFGSTNQYFYFVLNLATLGSPLRSLLKKKSIFHCNEEQAKAFKIKEETVNLAENTLFDVKRNTRVTKDESHNGLGASLKQLHGNDWKTVSFTSRFLNPHESKYSTNELELLGVVWPVEYYYNYLHPRNLKSFLTIKPFFQHFHLTTEVKHIIIVQLDGSIFTIKHLAGKHMGFTDLISRIPSGKAIRASHYDEEFVVATFIKINEAIYATDNRKMNFNSIGSNLENSSLARLRNYLIASVVRFINSTVPICNLKPNTTEFYNSKCIPSDFSSINSNIKNFFIKFSFLYIF